MESHDIMSPEGRRNESAHWYDESFRRDLLTFRLFTNLYAWLPQKFLHNIRDLYWEYPAFLGQILFYALFILLNSTLQMRGTNILQNTPSIFYFAIDLLNLGFLREPYLIVFMFFAFLMSWGVNKLALIAMPRVRNSSSAILLLTAFATGLFSLAIFSVFFGFMISAAIE